MLRKLGVIFLGLVISLFLTPQVGSAKPLLVSPSSLSFAIPPGGVDTCYQEKAYKAWIAIEYKDSYLKIRAFCFNDTSEDQVLRYKLEAKKSGKSGTAHTCQSGPVCIPSQEKKCLSQLTLGISPKDCYQIKLEVYKNGKLVAGDSVFYPQILEACNPTGIASPFPLGKTR